uniref:Transmembrane protein n=1 Tax=Fagus sylvatica TaxID=28930 RepID=A0A2N9J0H4_FAGSY
MCFSGHGGLSLDLWFWYGICGFGLSSGHRLKLWRWLWDCGYGFAGMGLWWMSGSLVAPCNVWWVGEPISVLGVAATWVSGWGFWVDGCL